MRNHALLVTADELNEFTRALKEHCIENGKMLVMMRNGDWCAVIFTPADKDDNSDDCFRSENYSRVWRLNGKSYASASFDLIEFN